MLLGLRSYRTACGNQESVAREQRPMVEEGKRAFVLEDDVSVVFATGDAAEEAVVADRIGHGTDLL